MAILKSKYYLVQFDHTSDHMAVLSDGFTSFRDALQGARKSPKYEKSRIIKGSVILKCVDPAAFHNSRNPLFTVSYEN